MRLAPIVLAGALASGSPAYGQPLDEDLLRIPPAFRSWLDPAGPLGGLGPMYPVAAELALARAASPAAAPAPRRSWLRNWAPTLLLGATLVVLETVADPPSNPRWSSKNASTILNATLGVALAADWVWLRDEYGLVESARTEVPWVLGSAVSSRVFKVATGRERPYVDPCSLDPSYISGCNDGRNDNASFYSGGATGSATFAGLLCARHLHRAERSGVDWAVCGGAVAGSLATGFTRVVADQHWFTDVLAGWATGALFGYVLPVHFQFRQRKPGKPPMMGLYGFTPAVGTRFFGLRYEKRF
jgi:membrane-associated phospholipid phosphatase